MGYVPLEDPNEDIKVKSIFCFVIAPEWKRKGIATQLLERVCNDAAQDGSDIVEAYPHKGAYYQSSDFGGHLEMYKKKGFQVSFENELGYVVQKQFRPPSCK